MNTYECSDLNCLNTWQSPNMPSCCPICGAQGRIKPPAPPGGTKVEG
jgi:hypothetical protein